MTSIRLRRMTVVSLLCGLTACAGTPVTEPPSVAPPELPQVNAAETLPAFEPTTGDAPRSIGISGGRGSVAPDSLVWVINLDGGVPAVVARADGNGSFAVPVDAFLGDELRMHVLVDGTPSLPLDMILGNGLVLAAPEHGSCIRTTPTMLDFGTVAQGGSSMLELEIENTCESALELTFSLHPGSTDFALDALGAQTLSPGEVITLSIAFVPTERALLSSSVLLIELTSVAESDRVAVSLFGHVR